MSLDKTPVELTKIVSGKRIVTTGNVIRSVEISGGVEPKNRITVELENSTSTKIVNLIEKSPSQFGSQRNHELSLSEEFYERWKMLKDAGLPVPNTMRITSETTIAMTDLTVDGSEIYGKTDAENVEFEEFLPPGSHRQPKELDQIFYSVSYEDMEKEALRIANIANKADISLPFDDPLTMIVHPDGNWELIILDLGDSRKGRVPDPDLKPTLSEQNEWLVKKFMTNIQLIQNKIGRTS